MFFVGLLVLAPYAKAQPLNSKESRPNIIYILADDLGYGNLTCYNPSSRVSTPNLDKMAQEGTRFNRFYAGSTVCAPSRCALMTGLHTGHNYIRGNGEVDLREKDSTLAQYMKQAGYTTGMFGKWGLGKENTAGAPQLKGWDEFVGYLDHRHAHNYYTDHLWQVRRGNLSRLPLDTTVYTHDVILNNALSFIEANQKRPFFLYLPVTLVHAELTAPPSDLKPFLTADGKSRLAPETPYFQKPAPNLYKSQPLPHAAFAAMLNRLDSDVGRLLALLKKLNLDQNTLVIFTSDNGPHNEAGADPEFFDSNGPLRGIKRDLYEGGIRVPMIARWPGRIPANRVDNSVWANWDMLPTFCRLINVTSPAGIDGLSMLPLLLGKQPASKHPYLYWQLGEGIFKQAILKEDWKLIRLKAPGKPEVLELYNLKTDEAEKNNLATQNPAKLAELQRDLKSAVTPAEHPFFDYSSFER